MTITYLLDTSPLENEELFKKHFDTVSTYRKEKIERNRLLKDKSLSLGAGILLDFALQSFGLREKDMEYISGENGKPFFKNHPEIHFNISHSKSCVICSVSENPVGCDTEKIGKADLRIAKRFFAEKEKNFVNSITNTEEQNESFYRIWTLKESYIKYTGNGLAQGLASFEFELDDAIALYDKGKRQNLYFKEYKTNGYRIAVCSEENDFAENLEILKL
ncbi:MAG: 4'-phosphopantetheinyl transferase superfamily protein [Ruminococcus sp.]|nr:4'-phosphopantetheinyl transferase superfamily protein [Ruminococcus sp.]